MTTSLLSVALMVFAAQAPKTPTYAAEADRLTRAVVERFYDKDKKIWRPKQEPLAESVGTQGFTFWPSLLAWQAVIEGAKVDPKRWKAQVAPYYNALEQYYDRADKAYCAWTFFPGNDDKFYDDNTWAAIACMEAYQVTREKRYRDRAIAIFDGFVRNTWDEKAPGLRWGTKAGIEDRHDRTVSATAAGALAALLIAPERGTAAQRTTDRAWAKRALDWIRNTLSQPNGLIQDGLKQDGTVMPTVWTYNTGVPIRAALEYARQTRDLTYRSWAKRMGDAAIDRTNAPLYDGAVSNPAKRYWYDGTYFVHYLVDGLRELSRATGDRRYIAEARRNADYIRTYLRDRDGFYWRSMRLWQINEDRAAAFSKLTGSTVAFAPDHTERSMAPEALAKPIEQRPMAKTLLANAGTARMYWLLSH